MDFSSLDEIQICKLGGAVLYLYRNILTQFTPQRPRFAVPFRLKLQKISLYLCTHIGKLCASYTRSMDNRLEIHNNGFA